MIERVMTKLIVLKPIKVVAGIAAVTFLLVPIGRGIQALLLIGSIISLSHLSLYIKSFE
jgi:hypothetical protein